MLPHARKEYLLRSLELHGSVRSSVIAQDLGVSEVTIRRDIAELDQARQVTKVHGGALALRTASPRSETHRTLIGLVVPSDVTHFPDVVRGMEAAAPGLRAQLVLGISHYHADLERARVDRLLQLGVRGLVIAPTTRDRSEDEVAHWVSSLPVPVVVLERQLTGAARMNDHARTDHLHGVALAMEHLAALGHKSIGLGLFERTPTARWIRTGWEADTARLGLVPAPLVSLPKGDDDPLALRTVLRGLIQACLDQSTRAVLVHTDDHAAILVQVAHEMGLDVPKDLAVVAYDSQYAELADVPLTAVSAPARDLGREALALVMRRVNQGMGGRDGGQSAGQAEAIDDFTPRHVLLLPRLDVRQSCGALADISQTGPA